jgi:hypothetical protein
MSVHIRLMAWRQTAGTGISAGIAEIMLGDGHAAIPIGSYQRAFGVTLPLPSIIRRTGVAQEC